MVVDRSNGAINFGIPCVSLIVLNVEVFDSAQLPPIGISHLVTGPRWLCAIFVIVFLLHRFTTIFRVSFESFLNSFPGPSSVFPT